MCRWIATVAAALACHHHHHRPPPPPTPARPQHHRQAHEHAPTRAHHHAPAERIEITFTPEGPNGEGLAQACAEAEAEGAETWGCPADEKAAAEGAEGPTIEWQENPVTGEQFAELEAEEGASS